MKTNNVISFLAFFLFCSINLSAQTEWAPIGAKWHYDFPYDYNNAETFLKIESIGDTVIDGITCKILEQESLDTHLNRRYYTYKAEDKVWVYDGIDFRILYDFTVQPQSEWTAYGPSLYQMCDTVTNVLVESAGEEELNGISFKYMMVSLPESGWHFNLCNPDQTRISEKFGSYGFMFPQQNCAIDVPSACFLRCYEDSEFGFFSSGVADSCTYEYGVGLNEIILAENVKVGPNPVSDILNIALKGNIRNSSFQIYSSTGKLIYNASVTDRSTMFNMSTYTQGIYILKVYHEGVFTTGKIIKM